MGQQGSLPVSFENGSALVSPPRLSYWRGVILGSRSLGPQVRWISERMQPLFSYASCRRRCARCTLTAAELGCNCCFIGRDLQAWFCLVFIREASCSKWPEIFRKFEAVSACQSDTFFPHTHEAPHQQGMICQTLLLSPTNQSHQNSIKELNYHQHNIHHK